MPEPFTDRKRLFTGPRVSLFSSTFERRIVFRAIIIRGLPYSSRVNTPSEAARKKRRCASARTRACMCVHPCACGDSRKSAEKQNCITSSRGSDGWLQLHGCARASLPSPYPPPQTIIVAAEAHRANDYAPILIS